MQSSRISTGFTLVEIAVVLVLVGVLLGGLLKAREIVTQSRIKSAIVELNDVATAYLAYQDRYRRLPGDDADAAARWALGPVANSSTAGNGILEGRWNDGAAAVEPETRLFWWHLRRANLLAGPTAPPARAAGQPVNVFGSLIGVATGSGAATLGMSGPLVCSSGLPGTVAAAVDTQLDDQAAGTGSVRAIAGDSSSALGPLAAPPAPYVETDSARYLLCRAL